jgi:hypothetical protein
VIWHVIRKFRSNSKIFNKFSVYFTDTIYEILCNSKSERIIIFRERWNMWKSFCASRDVVLFRSSIRLSPLILIMCYLYGVFWVIHSDESIQHSDQAESLKSRLFCYVQFTWSEWVLNFSARFMNTVSIVWKENSKIVKQMEWCGNLKIMNASYF